MIIGEKVHQEPDDRKFLRHCVDPIHAHIDAGPLVRCCHDQRHLIHERYPKYSEGGAYFWGQASLHLTLNSVAVSRWASNTCRKDYEEEAQTRGARVLEMENEIKNP